MGIPKCRFLDRSHEQFTCAICLDVAIDPVLVNSDTDCDHLFCKTCIGSDVARCPTCNGEFKDPKCNEIKGVLKRVYSDLRMKCLNPSCDKILIPSNYENHDENCPIIFEICKDCRFKSRRGPNNDHSCIQVLKAELVKTTEKLDEQQVKSAEKIEELEKRIQMERKRMEHLIYVCIRYRSGYFDSGGDPIGATLDALTSTLDRHKKIVEWFNNEFKNKHGI